MKRETVGRGDARVARVVRWTVWATHASPLLLVLALGSPALAATAAKVFPSAEEATRALVAALKADDAKALTEIFGSDGAAILNSGDPVADENARTGFTELYEQKHELTKRGDATVLVIGPDQWPFPIPLQQTSEGWHFDTAAGREELINRRVGRNELSAIQAALAYVDAQREYYERSPEGEPLRYAQKMASSRGKRDGLYWETAEDQQPSPLGELFVSARAEGYAMKGRGDPFHGYYYRILTAQGPDAAGGAYDYVVRGKMIGGFALVAYPAQYGVSGVMTFLVNHDGVVFEKDLGPKTADAAKAMKTFNPDGTWKRVEDTQHATAE
jgi:hypothetical protein